MVSFQRLIKKKATILFDVSAITFLKTLLYIPMHFHNLAYSIFTTFYRVDEYIKILQTERN